MAITHFGNKTLRGVKADRVVDSLGSSVDGTNTGVTLISGIQKYADLDGSNDYINLGGSASDWNLFHAPSGSCEYSVSMWIKLDTVQYTQIFTTEDNSEQNGVVMYVNSATQVGIQTWYGGSQHATTITTSTWEAGKWYHLVITRNGGTFKIYKDGTEYTGSSSATGNTNNASYVPRISGNHGQTNYRLDGGVSQVIVYTDQLTQSEVTELYNSGTPVSDPTTLGSDGGSIKAWYKFESDANDSHGSLNGTATGVTWISDAFKLGSGCYSFDGSNDYVSIDDSSANLIQGRSSAWTIAGWLKRDGSTDKYFISQWGKNSSPDNRVFHIGIDSNGKLLYRQRTDGGQGASFTSNGAIANNTWTHFAIVWQPNGSNWQAQMYINGTADNSKTDFANDMRGGSIAEPIYFGKNGSDATAPSAGGDYFNGELDDLAVWHRALTATEIGKLANNNVGGDSGWSKTSSNINIQNNRVDFDTTSSGSSTSALSYDIGTANISGTWVLRGKSVITNYTVGGDGSSCHLFCGFSDKDHTTAFDGNQDSISFAIGAGTNDDNYYIGSSDGGAMYSMTSHTNGQTTHEPTEETLYWELKRTGTTGVTLTLYTDSGYSTSPSGYSKSVTLSSEPTGLRYLVFKSRDRSVSGSDCIGYMDDLKFWDNTTTASGTPDNTFDFNAGDAQSVSSSSDKSGLKANYTMDSTQLKTADLSSADWSENFSSASPTSYYEHYTSGYNGNMEPYKDSSNGLWIDLDDFTGKVVGTLDLQNAGLMSANANDNYWTLRFKVNFSSITNGTGSVWIGLSSNTDASRDTQKFVGVRFKSNSAGMTTGASRYTGGSALSGSSGENDTGTTASTYSANTDYYVTVTRNGTGTDSTRTATVKAEIRTGSHTGTLLGTSYDDIYAQTGLRYFKVMNNRLSSGTAGQHRGRIYDVEFYDNEADVDGCKNDASTTSDLEAMTNLPTNTVFLQTDDTPSYWWKQSDNTWAKEKYLVTDEWDFSNSTNWVLSDSSDVTIADGVLNIQCNDNSVTRTATVDLENVLGSGGRAGNTWVLRWKWNLTGYTNSTHGQGVGYSIGIWNAVPSGWNTGTTGLDARCSTHGADGNATYHPQVFVSGSRSDSSSSSFSQSSMGTRYCELIKDASNLTLKVYTTSDFSGSPEHTVVRSYTQSQHTGGRYIGYRMVNESVSQTNNISIDDLQFYNNKTSV